MTDRPTPNTLSGTPGTATRRSRGEAPCWCAIEQRDAMAEALRVSANGDPALLLRARVEMSRHLARHVLSDAERAAEEAKYREMLTPDLYGPAYEVF